MSNPRAPVEAIIIGKFRIELCTEGHIWIGRNSGPAAGEGGMFKEADVEKMIEDWYATNF